MEGAQWSAFPLAPTPHDALDIAGDVYRFLALSCQVRVVWLETAYGRGGFYNGGVVAIGREDLEGIVARVWGTFYTPIPASSVNYHRSVGTSLRTIGEIRRAVTEYIVSHELGHALQAEVGSRLVGVARENDADQIAGCAAGARGHDTEVGQQVARVIGCRDGIACTHGDPDARQSFYTNGVLRAWAAA